MIPLALIIALELVFTTGIIGLSSHPQTLNKTKHKISNVLGIQKITQVDDSATPPSDNTPSDSSSTPVDNSQPSNDNASSNPEPTPGFSSSDQNQTTSTASDQSGTSNQSSFPESPISSDNPSLFEQEINSSPAPKGQEGSSPNPQSSGEPSPSPDSVETNISETQAVLSPDDLINSPENINNKSVMEAKKEDTQLEQTTDPTDQTNLLINFATNKVKDMSNFTQADDFTSTNFAAQRFNEQMDKAIINLEKIPPKDQVKLKKQLVNFCYQADSVLKTVQLAVPEQSEQDLEMARGQCQELNL